MQFMMFLCELCPFVEIDDQCGSPESHVRGRVHKDKCVGVNVSLRDGFFGVWKDLLDGVSQWWIL